MARIQFQHSSGTQTELVITGNQFYGHDGTWQIHLQGTLVATRRARATAELIAEELYSQQEVAFDSSEIQLYWVEKELTEAQKREHEFNQRWSAALVRMKELEGHDPEQSVEVNLSCGHEQRLPRGLAEDSMAGLTQIPCHLCETHYGAPSYGGYKSWSEHPVHVTYIHEPSGVMAR